MPALTATERQVFSGQQLAQLARLSAARRDELFGTERAANLAKLASRTEHELRARVNILRVRGGKIVDWAPENDYSAEQQEAIQEGLQEGKGGWLRQAAEITAAGRSLKQRVETLEAL